MVSRARCGACLYLLLIFAFFILHLRLQRTLHAKLWFSINFMQHSFGALNRNFRLTKFRKFRGWQPAGPAGDGETQTVWVKCCLMSLSGYLLRLVEIGPLCFVFLQLFLLTIPRRCFFCGSFLLFMLHVCLLGSLQPCDHLSQAGRQTGRQPGRHPKWEENFIAKIIKMQGPFFLDTLVTYKLNQQNHWYVVL